MNRFSILAMVATGLFLAACDNNSSAPKTEKNQQSVKACELLTPGDIKQVTGQAMQSGESKYGITCRYGSVATNKVGLAAYQVLVRLVRHSEGLETEVQNYDTMIKQGLGKDAGTYTSKSVAGVGDRAIWEAHTGVAQLVVFKSSGPKATATVFIQPDGFGSEQQSLEYAKGLALRALKRL